MQNGWSRNPQPRIPSFPFEGQQPGESALSFEALKAQVEDLEWRDRWNAKRIERLSTRLVQAERAACELAEQLERVRAERDNLLRSLLKASLEARP